MTSTQRKAMELALEQLRSVLCDPEGNVCWHGSYADRDIIGDALDVFRAALAEPQHQLVSPELESEIMAALAEPQWEPVAATHLGWDYLDSGRLVATYFLPVAEKVAPNLYTAPQPAIPTMDDAISAGDGVLMSEQAELLRECRAALDALIAQKPTLAGLRCGSTTLGNLKASLYAYRPQGIFGETK